MFIICNILKNKYINVVTFKVIRAVVNWIVEKVDQKCIIDSHFSFKFHGQDQFKDHDIPRLNFRLKKKSN